VECVRRLNLADQEGVRDDLDRGKIGIAGTTRDQRGETIIEARIFPIAGISETGLPFSASRAPPSLRMKVPSAVSISMTHRSPPC
jgi:hypothetical protein